MNRRFSCALFSSTIVLVLCATTVGVAAEMATPVASGLEWGDCPFEVGEGVRCGKLAVPEDWSRPETSRTISVSFAVIPAGNAAKKAEDPIAFLTGGPGFSAFAAMDAYPRMAVNRTRDIIVMEPRGYGYSDPALLCDGVGKLAECHAHFTQEGFDLNQYTTEASVRDYDPFTPPEFAEAMLLTMSKGTLVLDPSTAHALFVDDNPCVHDIMVRFVDAPEEHVDVSCLVETPRAHWLLPHEWPEVN